MSSTGQLFVALGASSAAGYFSFNVSKSYLQNAINTPESIKDRTISSLCIAGGAAFIANGVAGPNAALLTGAAMLIASYKGLETAAKVNASVLPYCIATASAFSTLLLCSAMEATNTQTNGPSR